MSYKSNIKRRDFLRYAGVAGVSVGVAPAIVSQALSSSGELNILMWSDYLPDVFVDSFTKKTGIKINHTAIGDNSEIIARMKTTKGEGFDICSPTNSRSEQWAQLGLLQPFNMNKVDTSKVNAGMVKIGTEFWNFDSKGSHWLPQTWGTEGMAWRTDLWSPKGGVPSYGDIWNPDVKGKSMARLWSMFTGTGLYLETTGELKKGDTMRVSYENVDKMTKVWDKIAKFVIANKSNIKLFWLDADSQKNGLLNDGVVVGQTWDGPPLSLKSAGEPVHYQAPKEGSMAWVDGMCMSAGAKNIDQIYEFIKHAYTPEAAGKATAVHGYNSPVAGADAFAGDVYAKNFAAAYPGDALANLNPWPPEPQWFADKRNEYVNRVQTA